MSYCDKCPHYKPEKVPVDFLADPSGEKYGFTTVRMCVADPDDECIAENDRDVENVKPCPTCGRDIDGYADCPDCLRIEIDSATYAAEGTEWERWFLANS